MGDTNPKAIWVDTFGSYLCQYICDKQLAPTLPTGYKLFNMTFQVSDWLVVAVRTKVELRFFMIGNGVQCVTTNGENQMLSLSAGSWDSLTVPLWKGTGEALVLFGWTMLGAGEKIGVYREVNVNSRETLFACNQ